MFSVKIPEIISRGTRAYTVQYDIVMSVSLNFPEIAVFCEISAVYILSMKSVYCLFFF